MVADCITRSLEDGFVGLFLFFTQASDTPIAWIAFTFEFGIQDTHRREQGRRGMSARRTRSNFDRNLDTKKGLHSSLTCLVSV